MKKTLVIIALVGLVAVLSGCTEQAAEKAAESAIESSTNNEAEVDFDDETVTVNTNAGSFTAGEEVALPDNFPDDVYVIDGTIISAMEVVESNGFSVSIQTDTSVADAQDAYTDELTDDGWEITGTMTIGSGATIIAEKDERTATVSISRDDDDNMTLVGITTASN